MSYSDDIATDLDKVRSLIGDTSDVTATELISDNEIDYYLTVDTNVKLAASHCAKVIAAKLSRRPNTRVGNVTQSYEVVVQRYLALADRLLQEARGVGSIIVTGIDIVEKEAFESESETYVQAKIKRGLHDNNSDE